MSSATNWKSFGVIMTMICSLLSVTFWFSSHWKLPQIQLQSLSFLNSPVSNTEAKKLVIYQCQNKEECGGLSDRQDGIVTSYVISQIIGASFGIQMNKPCPLSNYLVPNKVNWTISLKALKNKTKATWKRIGRKKDDVMFSFENLTSSVTVDVLFYTGNVDLLPFLMKNPIYKKLPWTQGLDRFDVYKFIYGQLFKLSASTQKRLNTFRKNVGKQTLFCSHIRFGINERLVHKKPKPEAVIDFLRKETKKKKEYTIFLASDSSNVAKLFNSSFGNRLITIHGPIVHIERAHGKTKCSGMQKVILDQKVLTLCDVLIMSRSGFSRTAAILRGSDENLYEALGKNVTKVKRMAPV